jgi:hypothetical protein
MTDEYKVEDQDIELHDDVEDEVVEEGHDPKNAETQSVASVDQAGEKTGRAKKRKGDNTKQDPMQKLPNTKAGMINASFQYMNSLSKSEMAELYGRLFAEGVEVEEGEELEARTVNYKTDFGSDLNALIKDEATLSEEFKDKAGVIFEAAINSKLAAEIDRLEEKYDEELNEAIDSTKSELVEKVDSYLGYVVEQWMEDNKVAIQAGLRTEIAENFMNSLKDLFTESYIEVPESKVDLVDELADTVEDLEEKLNKTTAQAIEMAEELEGYQRDAIIRENSRDLAETQIEKLKSLVADVDFESEETFAKKVSTVKESYFTKKTSTEAEEIDGTEDGETPAEVSSSMDSYLSALKSQSKK